MVIDDLHSGSGQTPSRTPNETPMSNIPGALEERLLAAVKYALEVDGLFCGIDCTLAVLAVDGELTFEERQPGPLHIPPSKSRDKLTSINGGRVTVLVNVVTVVPPNELVPEAWTVPEERQDGPEHKPFNIPKERSRLMSGTAGVALEIESKVREGFWLTNNGVSNGFRSSKGLALVVACDSCEVLDVV